MIQLKNCWMDLDEIWYGCYAIEGYPIVVVFNFLQSIIPTWQMIELVKWGRHMPLTIGPCNDVQQ
jgi:hypothetical protein